MHGVLGHVLGVCRRRRVADRGAASSAHFTKALGAQARRAARRARRARQRKNDDERAAAHFGGLVREEGKEVQGSVGGKKKVSAPRRRRRPHAARIMSTEHTHQTRNFNNAALSVCFAHFFF